MNFFVVFVKLFVSAYLININELVSGSITFYNEKNITLEIIESVSAAFGPHISEQGFKGYIVVANPIGGCSALQKPPKNVSYVDPDQWIVLIKRTPSIYGNCSFDLKVRNAQLAGYKAVIIYNSESDNLIKMSSSGIYDITIPSVFISHSDGLEIGTFYTYLNRTYAVINNDDDNLNYLLIPFICVVAVCFIIAVSIFVSKFAFHVYKLRKNRFPKSALKKIPTRKYQKTDKYDTCPICLNEYEEGEKMRILPCEHAYHVECIDKWLLRNNRFCPVCKRRVLPGGSDSESSDDGRENNTNSTQAHVPNDDDDTNESSRLLLNVRNNSNEDTASEATISTILNTVTTTNETSQNNLNQNAHSQYNMDLNSMNNQMTASMTSSQAPNNQNKDLRSSSSRYGSMASSLNIVTNATTSKSVEKQDSDSENDNETEEQKSAFIYQKKPSEQIDSKATPEFQSPIEPDLETRLDSLADNAEQVVYQASNTQSDLPQVNIKPMKKKNSKRKNKNEAAQDNSEARAVDENLVESNDKQALLHQLPRSKSKKLKKKSLYQASSNSNSNTPARNNDDDIDPLA